MRPAHRALVVASSTFQPASERTGDCDIESITFSAADASFQPASERTGDCDSGAMLEAVIAWWPFNLPQKGQVIATIRLERNLQWLYFFQPASERTGDCDGSQPKPRLGKSFRRSLRGSPYLAFSKPELSQFRASLES